MLEGDGYSFNAILRTTNMQRSASEEQMMNETAVLITTLPMPAKGDTIPPNKNPLAPTTADAAPMYLRPAFMAEAVAEVQIQPSPSDTKNIITS